MRNFKKGFLERLEREMQYMANDGKKTFLFLFLGLCAACVYVGITVPLVWAMIVAFVVAAIAVMMGWRLWTTTPQSKNCTEDARSEDARSEE